MADELVKSILALRHPAYVSMRERWERAERRLRGGEEVAAELTPFDWEEPNGEHHKKRIASAVYLPLGFETARKFVDSVSREAPVPGEATPTRALSFGTLGTVRPSLGGVAVEGSAAASDGTGVTDMTRAEMVWTNVDGTGDDGSDWDGWWDGVQRRTMATGFRWVGVEAGKAPVSEADEAQGARPYAVEYAPSQTPYWRIEAGTLQALHVEVTGRALVDKGGKVVEAEEAIHLLYVRQGFLGFGARFAVGGWWRFTKDGDPAPLVAGQPAEGRWDSTGGAIPFIRFFYERDPRSVSGARAGLDEVNSIATGLMDLEGAARHDALVGGGRTIYAAGISKGAHKEAVAQIGSGSRFVGIETNAASTVPVTLYDMAAATASDAIEREMSRLLSWAQMIATKELTTSPDASGKAKAVEYEAEVSPRLSYMAKMRQEAQGFIIRMFELRFGGAGTKPAGSVRYPRRYSLESVAARLAQAVTTIAAAGVSSPTLSARLADAAVAEAGLGLTDEERKTIGGEIREGSVRKAQADALTDDLLAA